MDDEVPVRMLDRGADREEEAQLAFERDLLLRAIRVDRPAVHELHDEIRQAVLGRAPVEERGDVGMCERSQDLPLVPEALQEVLRVEARADELDGDFLPELLVRAPRQIDRSHSPPSDLADQLVRSDAFPRFPVGAFPGSDQAGQRLPDPLRDRLGSYFVEERLDLRAQRRVLAAGLPEESIALFFRELHGVVEDLPRSAVELGCHALLEKILPRGKTTLDAA